MSWLVQGFYWKTLTGPMKYSILLDTEQLGKKILVNVRYESLAIVSTVWLDVLPPKNTLKSPGQKITFNKDIILGFYWWGSPTFLFLLCLNNVFGAVFTLLPSVSHDHLANHERPSTVPHW